MKRHVGATKIFSSERLIVVGVDGSQQSKWALVWAAHEATVRDALVRVVGVAPAGNDEIPGGTEQDAAKDAAQNVDDALELASRLEPTALVRGDVVNGSPADVLVEASEVADLLVVGTGSRGAVTELLLGSVSQKCVQHARCPVVLVHQDTREVPLDPGARIVVDVDNSAGSDRAVTWALEEAAFRTVGVEGIVACGGAHEDDPAAALPEDCRDMADRYTQVTTSFVTHRGAGHLLRSKSRCVPTVEGLLQSCQGAALLVVAAQGRRALHDRVAGSLAQQCAHRSPCPVVVVGPHARSTVH